MLTFLHKQLRSRRSGKEVNQGHFFVITTASMAVLAALIFPMRATAVSPDGRFHVSPDRLTATDSKTKLVWQRDPPRTVMAWTEARSWCRTNRALLPGAGWRLPSVEELQTIFSSVDYRPNLDISVFPVDVQLLNFGLTFWTSTKYTWTGKVGFDGYPIEPSAWSVRFIDFGVAMRRPVSELNLVRCVR